jgi:hypothetical protein
MAALAAGVDGLDKNKKAAMVAHLCGTSLAYPSQLGNACWRRTPEGMAFCQDARTAGTTATVNTHFSENVWRSEEFRATREALEADYAIALAEYKNLTVTGIKEDEVLLLAGAVPEVLDLPGGGRVRVMRTAGGKYFNPKQLFDSKDAIIASLQPKKRAKTAASPAAGGSSSESAPASKRAKCGRKIALPAAKELDTAAV